MMKKDFYLTASFSLVLFFVSCNHSEQLNSDLSAAGKVGEFSLQSERGFTAMNMQNDGKTIVIGTQMNSAEKIIVARFLPDGQPDPGFASDSDPKGVRWIDIADDGITQRAFQWPKDVVIDKANNNIVVCGFYRVQNWFFGWETLQESFGFVARLLPNGDLDRTFDGDGIKILNLGSNGSGTLDDNWTTIHACDIQSDGKIVAVGHSINGNGEAVVVRLNIDGSFDNTFDKDGVAYLNLSKRLDVFVDVKIDKHGQVIALGQRDYELGHAGVAVITKLLPDGNTDGSFGFDGSVDINNSLVARWIDVAYMPTTGSMRGDFENYGHLLLQEVIDYPTSTEKVEKIIVSAECLNMMCGNDSYIIKRFRQNSSIDTDFALGKALTFKDDVPGPAINLDSNNRLLVARSNDKGTVLRFNENGSKDLTFGIGGSVDTRMFTAYSADITEDTLTKNLVIAGGGGESGIFLPFKLTKLGFITVHDGRP